MSCCAPATELALEIDTARRAGPTREELVMGSRPLGDGLFQTDLSVPAVHCAACIQSIESGVRGLDGVAGARVNLSTKRLSVRWRDGADDGDEQRHHQQPQQIGRASCRERV